MNFDSPETQKMMTANPLLALWTMPFMMAQAWVGAFTPVTKQQRELPGDQSSEPLPVPQAIQDNDERDTFA